MGKIDSYRKESYLNQFVKAEWPKVVSFLRNGYGIAEEESKDIFQEAFIILHNNMQSGKLSEMTSSLSTYFISICKNKAYEFLRASSKTVNVEEELSLSIMEGAIKTDKVNELLELDDENQSNQERKEALVRHIVQHLPSPCNELLWGYYRDNLSMRTLADMFNYSSESSVKVTKHRCCDKFRKRYKELSKNLF